MESKVVLQPVGSPKAQEHFVRTIQGAVDISIVKRLKVRSVSQSFILMERCGFGA